MVNIELTPQQAEELKNFYISELDKLLKRSDVIKEIINKLDTELRTSGCQRPCN